MWYDLVVVAILLYTMLRGAARGLVWQLAWIAALVLCFFFAETASVALAPHIRVNPPLNRWIAMFVLYIGFSFLSFGAARVLRGWIEKAKFQEFDRHLGGLFGLLKGAVFSLVLTFFAITLSDSLRETITKSHSGYAACLIMNHLHPVMPAELHDVLEPYIHQLDGAHDVREPDFEIADSLPGSEQSSSGLNLGELFPTSDTNGRDELPPVEHEGSDRPEPLSLQDLVKSLPGAISRELQDAAIRRLREAEPAARESFIDRLKSATPEQVRDTLQRLTSDGSARSDTAEPVVVVDFSDGAISKLVQDISNVYSDAPAARQDIESDIRKKLDGLPEQVVSAVLEDWYADLMSTQPDPDPGTRFSTQLDERVLRQLESARIPLTRLSDGLQQRLKNLSIR